MTRVTRERPNSAWWLFLFIAAGYFVWFGGSGLAAFRLRLTSTLLIGLIGLVAITLCTASCAHAPLWGRPADGLARRRDISLAHGILWRTTLDWPLAATLVALLVTTITSRDPRHSLEAVPAYLGYLLVFYAVIILIRIGWPRVWFFSTLIAVSVPPMLFALGEVWSWLAAWRTIGHAGWPPVATRVTALMAHPNYAAALFNALLPLVLSQLLLVRHANLRWLLGAWCLGALGVVYFTSSRGGWLATAAAAVVWGIGAAWALPGLRSRGVHLLAQIQSRRWLLVSGIAVVVLGFVVLGWGLVFQAQHATHGPLFSSRNIMWEPAQAMFLASPWVGIGPRLYGVARLAFISSPPYDPYAHAHNYAFNLATEQGLVGVAALMWLGNAIVVGIWRAWRSADNTHRALLAGSCAALVGLAVHSLFDEPTNLLPLGLIAMVLMATCVVDAPPGNPTARRREWAGFALLCVGMIALAGWSLWGHSAYAAGVNLAERGDWRAAAQQWELATHRDPGFALYHFQAGLAHATLAAETSDPGHLAEAIRYYEQGLAIEPLYAVNRADLAALYWQAGRSADAVEQMKRAAASAPEEATFALNLGLYQEKLGDLNEASVRYSRALNLRPEWADAFFWRATPFRAQTLQAWQVQYAQEPGPGWKELSEGQPAEAVQQFVETLRKDPRNSTAYFGWGNALLASGDLATAEYAFKAARLTAIKGEERLNADLALSQLLAQRGASSNSPNDSAMDAAERAWAALRTTTLYGPGTAGLLLYEFRLFERESVATDAVPQLLRITITDRITNQLVQLGDWYVQRGDVAAARAVYSELLKAAPDLDAAQQRLKALEGK